MDIQPIQFLNKTAVKIEIVDIVIKLDVSASWIVNFRDAEDNLVYSTKIFIDNGEYDAWGSDDNYIKNITVEKLGLTL